jgi:hypothetical protein
MEKTRIATLITIASVVTIAIIGVAYAQYINGQGLAANSYYGSAQGYNRNYGYPNTYNDGYYQCPRQSGYTYGTPQGGYPSQYGMGMSGFHK